MNIFRSLVTWVLAGLGLIMAFGVTLSPAFLDQLYLIEENTLQVEAHLQVCEPRRDGAAHHSVIHCRFTYRYDDRVYMAEGIAWRSGNPFLTTAGLHQELRSQLASPRHIAYFRADRPSDAVLADPRWLSMPPAWAWLIALFVILLVLLHHLDPRAMQFGRMERGLDPLTGLLPRITQQVAAAMLVGLCLFCLSNQPANLAATAFMTGLQPVPAQLTDCDSRWVGGSRGGHDQIDCAFTYTVGGQVFRGQAESLEYGFLPTKSRLDAEVATIVKDAATTAYIDSNYPGYAWAFISTDAFVPFTWGVFELFLSLPIGIGVLYILRTAPSKRPLG
jgi:hypothetical protein